jgi:hypothetical protein
MPLVFIILIYGLLKLLIEKPWVWGQGADMSLRTTWWVGRVRRGVSYHLLVVSVVSSDLV